MEDGPGLIVIRIDGMSRPALDDVLSSGRMPTLGALVSSGRLKLDRWLPLLPSCTPASPPAVAPSAYRAAIRLSSRTIGSNRLGTARIVGAQ